MKAKYVVNAYDKTSIAAEFSKICDIKGIVNVPAQPMIDRMKSEFASTLDEQEKILFCGRDFQLLVTDEYVHLPNRVIALEDIFIVTSQKSGWPGKIKSKLKSTKMEVCLHINGEAVLKSAVGYFPSKFIKNVLEALAASARMSGKKPSFFEVQEQAAIAAANVTDRRGEKVATQMLQAAGMDKHAASDLYQWMHAYRRNSIQVRARMTMALSAICFTIAFMMKLMTETHNWFWLILLLASALKGLQGLLSGLTKRGYLTFKTNRLMTLAWLKRHYPDVHHLLTHQRQTRRQRKVGQQDKTLAEPSSAHMTFMTFWKKSSSISS